VSVPYGITTPGEPNISSTRWRTVADHKRRLYFFESAMTPSTFWVDLNKADFSRGAPVLKLDLGPDQRNVFAGDALGRFQAAEPFRFLGIEG
jgi:choloylglycine hydrolase